MRRDTMQCVRGTARSSWFVDLERLDLSVIFSTVQWGPSDGRDKVEDFHDALCTRARASRARVIVFLLREAARGGGLVCVCVFVSY